MWVGFNLALTRSLAIDCRTDPEGALVHKDWRSGQKFNSKE